ncbi:MAG: tetratricopeptide repeat protein [Deltaproteobacteria bacterium]
MLPKVKMKKSGRFFAVLVLGVAILAVFGQGLHHAFINFDYDSYISSNNHIAQGISWQGLRWALSSSYAGHWHPVTWISHMLDISMFGLQPGYHHLVSVGFHLANTLLLLLLFRQMTGSFWRSYLLAVLFALHPLHVESVSWVAERKDFLSGFFWIVTTLFYVQYSRRPGWKRYAGVVISYSLGLMSKPMLVSLPFTLLLLDYWPLRRFSSKPSEKQDQVRRKNSLILLEKGPLLALAAFSCLITYFSQKSSGAVSSFTQLPLTERIPNAFLSYLLYLKKMFWPLDLAIFYPYARNIPAWQMAGSILILGFISWLVLNRRTKSPVLLVGWFWYLITLVPVIGLVQVGQQAMADRYTYIPLIGIFLMFCWAPIPVPEVLKSNKPLFHGISSLLIVILACLSFRQAGYFKNSLTLFQHALAVTKNNSVAHFHVAEALVEEKRYPEAITHYQQALNIRPNWPKAHNNLGVAFYQEGILDDSIQEFLIAIQLRPAFADAHYNLGIAYGAKGLREKAGKEMRLGMQLKK